MNWQSRRINFLRRWYTLLVITSLVLLTTCKDKNEINFDFNRVSGDYEVRIGCFEPDCEFKGEGIATLTQTEGPVLNFALVASLPDTLPEIKIRIIPPVDVIRSWFTQYTANIELVENQTIKWRLNKGHGHFSHARYWDSDDENGSAIRMTLENITDPQNVFTIVIEGDRDY